MEIGLLDELEKMMKKEHLKIPAIAVKLGIPKDRIYKWYQQGTKPKAEDSVKVWNWINGIKDVPRNKEENELNEFRSSFEEPEMPFINPNMATLLRIIEKQQETIHFLTTGRQQDIKRG